MLKICEIFRAADDVNTLFSGFSRLVGISEDNKAWLMKLDVYKPSAETTEIKRVDTEHLIAPFFVHLDDLLEAILTGQIKRNQLFDCGLPASVEQLSKSVRAKLESNYFMLKPLLTDEKLLYDSIYRSQEFIRQAQACGVSSRNIRRLYYRYLWGGMTKLAIIAMYQNCGSPGEEQPMYQKCSNTDELPLKKQGRRGRRAKQSVQCTVSLPEVRSDLEKGARRYYIPGNHTLNEAHVATLTEYFSAGMQIENVCGKRTLIDALVPEENQPTIAQFRRVCEIIELQEGNRKRLPRLLREKKSPWEFRGNARQGVSGPGARFEIDATKLQVQLIARYGLPKLVGNPTLYVLIDVWSKAIVGYALSLENAGWALAARALHNAFQSKGQVFQRLGLQYSEEDWPCCHLPTRLTADRAEFLSDKSGVVPEIGIKIEIMPPMCPELKGSVERAIKDVKHGRSKKIPGSYPKMPVRRESDGKSDAALTLDEMEIIIVRQIMKLNNDPVPLEHLPHEFLNSGEKYLSRINLYRWGLLNRPGYTRTLPSKEVYANLLSKDGASVTPSGISFKGQTYFSNILAEVGYLEQASNGHFPIEIRYDEHFADQIWFLDRYSNDWVSALVENEEIRRLKIAFYELENFYADAKPLIKNTRKESIYQDQEAAKQDAAMISDAIKNAKDYRGDFSKTEGKSKIRINRQNELEARRMIESQNAIESYTAAITNSRSAIQELPDEEDPIQPTKSIAALSEQLWKAHK
ncbi:MAG: DDE-type integrase/transposase/recombinase [Chlorobium sp.]|nr:DDE-type integrase/transposase/recombinase [Chlorobium sp.]